MNDEIEISISCLDCVRRATPDCADCLVSFVLGEEPDALTMTSVDTDVAQLLSAQGMIPRLKFRNRGQSPLPWSNAESVD